MLNLVTAVAGEVTCLVTLLGNLCCFCWCCQSFQAIALLLTYNALNCRAQERCWKFFLLWPAEVRWSMQVTLYCLSTIPVKKWIVDWHPGQLISNLAGDQSSHSTATTKICHHMLSTMQISLLSFHAVDFTDSGGLVTWASSDASSMKSLETLLLQVEDILV